MAVFLILDETDVDGRFLRKTAIDAESIFRIDAVGSSVCSLRMRSSPSESLYVKGTLEQMQIKLNCACS